MIKIKNIICICLFGSLCLLVFVSVSVLLIRFTVSSLRILTYCNSSYFPL